MSDFGERAQGNETAARLINATGIGLAECDRLSLRSQYCVSIVVPSIDRKRPPQRADSSRFARFDSLRDAILSRVLGDDNGGRGEGGDIVASQTGTRARLEIATRSINWHDMRFTTRTVYLSIMIQCRDDSEARKFFYISYLVKSMNLSLSICRDNESIIRQD